MGAWGGAVDPFIGLPQPQAEVTLAPAIIISGPIGVTFARTHCSQLPNGNSAVQCTGSCTDCVCNIILHPT